MRANMLQNKIHSYVIAILIQAIGNIIVWSTRINLRILMMHIGQVVPLTISGRIIISGESSLV